MAIAIKIENLSKQYRLGLVSTLTLSHDLNRWWQTSVLRREDPYLKIGQENILSSRNSPITNQESKIKNQKSQDYVWALKDINLEVEQGEVLGIIGKNGAGKSTLLKILSKVTAPTTGIIKARGRIASLLEVGTGFHQEMTGRENIYMNGAIMGMTKAEISRKFDEIVDFAGVERYIDTPVKRYSSGMTVRLGFAVAAHLEPEILVVDEVLAVGDAEFQKKAVGKMEDVTKKMGRTILFVSHNLASIRNLCNKTILLNNGIIIKEGPTENIVNYYLDQNRSQDSLSVIDLSKLVYNGTLIAFELRIKNHLDNYSNQLLMGEKATFEIFLNRFYPKNGMAIGLIIKSMEDEWITSITTLMNANDLSVDSDGIRKATLLINKLPLTINSYKIDISITAKNEGRKQYTDTAGIIDVCANDIYGTGYEVTSYFGKVYLDGEWTISDFKMSHQV